MILSGRLADWSVADLLRILRITAKTASLRIQGPDGGGTLYFDHGLLVGASVDDLPARAPGPDHLVECVYLLQLLPEGSFDIGTDTPSEPFDAIDADEILEQARALLEADMELRQAGLLEGDPVRLAAGGRDPVTLGPADWSVITALVGDIDLRRLEGQLGRPEAVAFLNRLRSTGLLATIGTQDGPVPAEQAVDVPVSDWGRQGEELTGYEMVSPAEAGLPELEEAFLSASPDTVPEIDAVAGGLGHQRMREMRSVISPAGTTLVPGVLDDIRQRFRPVEERPLD